MPVGGDDRELQMVERELAELLPLHTTVTELWWMTQEQAGYWECREVFPLGE